MKENIRVMVAAGGTAGHINPALAIANHILERLPSAVIRFVGRSDGMESSLVTKAGFDFVSIEVHGFQRKLSFANIKRNMNASYLLVKAMPEAKKLLKEFEPDIVIGTGGYICGPIMKMAQRMGIKTAIHESNSFAGVTNKLLAKKADVVFAVNEKATEALHVPHKTIISGNPVRQEIILAERKACRAAKGISDDSIVVLSFGGSLGALAVNRAVAGFMKSNTEQGLNYIHYHSTGRYSKTEFARLFDAYGLEKNKQLRISEYIDDMATMLAVCDLVISRSGAITVSEIAAAGRASILIPSPNVAENHQYHNAMSLVEVGAAVLILEEELNDERLSDEAQRLLADPQKLKEMGIAARQCHVQDALPKIYRQIEKLFEH